MSKYYRAVIQHLRISGRSRLLGNRKTRQTPEWKFPNLKVENQKEFNKIKEKHNRSKSLENSFDAELKTNHKAKTSNHFYPKRQNYDPRTDGIQTSKLFYENKHASYLSLPFVRPNHLTVMPQSKPTNDLLHAKPHQKRNAKKSLIESSLFWRAKCLFWMISNSTKTIWESQIVLNKR